MTIHLHGAHDQTLSHWQTMKECSLSDIGVHHRTIGLESTNSAGRILQPMPTYFAWTLVGLVLAKADGMNEIQ
jgi:hypothetical protein